MKVGALYKSEGCIYFYLYAIDSTLHVCNVILLRCMLSTVDNIRLNVQVHLLTFLILEKSLLILGTVVTF